MNIVDRIELEIETFKTAHGEQPTKIKLGRAQVRAFHAFADKYSSHRDPNARAAASPNYEGILIDETSAEDQLDVE